MSDAEKGSALSLEELRNQITPEATWFKRRQAAQILAALVADPNRSMEVRLQGLRLLHKILCQERDGAIRATAIQAFVTPIDSLIPTNIESPLQDAEGLGDEIASWWLRRRQEVRHYRILVTDDDTMMCKFCTRLLEHVGFDKVKSADDTHRAIMMASAWEPALVTTDLVKPEMSGFEMIDKIRANTGAFKTLLSSGFGPTEGVDVDARLPKPFSHQDWVRTVEMVLAGRLRD